MSAPARIRLDAQHPYPGPSSFDEDHAAFFCGRTREADDLFALVELRPLTVVYGKSGLGKTSLMQAGLFPRMRKAGLVPIRIKLLFGVDERGERQPALADQVRQRFREAIERDELDGVPPRDGESLWEYFHWAGFWDADGRPVTAVLVLDQFEEVFTLGHERKPELAELMRELSDLVENRIPVALREAEAPLPPTYDTVGAKALIALREEFLAQLDDHRPQMPSLATGRFRVRPLGGADARCAVLDPGREVVTEEVADRIVRRVASAADDARLEDIEEVEPALLALYCHELNALRDKAKLPKIDVALLAGSEKDILDKFYDRCMKGMPKEVHLLLEERLLTPDDRRDTIAFGRAVDLGVDPRHLTALVDRRLLRRVPLLGHEYVQIVHDKLVATIARRRDERQRRDERDKASRRLWRRLRTAGLVLVATSATAIFAYLWRENAAAEVEKVKTAKAQLASAEARASGLAEDGWRAADDQRWDDVARVLRDALSALNDARAIRAQFPREIGGASEAPADLGLLAERFEAIAGRIQPVAVGVSGIERFALSKDGSRGAALGTDGRTITLIDMESAKTRTADSPGKQGSIDDDKDKVPAIEATEVFSGAVRELALSGDGSTLLGRGDKGQVAVWDAASGVRRVGFRVRLARPTLQIDRSGSRVLVWDRDVDRAIVVKLGASKRAPVSVELEMRGAEPPGPGKWDHATCWREMVLASDGRRVVGLCEESSRRADRKPPRTEIAVWELPTVEQALPAIKPAAQVAVIGRLEGATVSEGGALLATRSDTQAVRVSDARELRVFSLHDLRITQKGAPRPLTPNAWFAFHDPSPALLLANDRTLSLLDLSGDPKARFEVPVGRVQKAALSPDGSLALVWTGDEVRLYDTKLGAPRAGAIIPDADRRGAAGVDVQLRLPGAAIVVTATSDAVRMRTLGGPDARPTDRYLWGELSATEAMFSGSIPRGSVVAGVDGDGEQLAVLADGALSIVRVSSPDRLAITPLAVREPSIGKALAASAAPQDETVLALRLRAGHVATLDASGSLRFSDARSSTLRRASHAASSGVLAISRDGTWVATGERGSKVWVWDAESGLPAWVGDTRKAHSKAPREGADTAVTALAVTSDGADRPRAIVGDASGRVIAIRTGGDHKGIEWTAQTFEPSLHAPAAVRAIEIASDGRVATAADNGTIAIWAKDGKLLRTIAIEPPAPVRVLRFTGDGRSLIGAVSDTVRVWPLDDGKQGDANKPSEDKRGCEIHHATMVRDIAVEGASAGAPSARVVSVDASDTAIVWTIEPCKALRLLRTIAYAGFLSGARDRVVTVRGTGRVELWPASDDASKEQHDRPHGASTWGVPLAGGGLRTGDEENAIFSWKTDGSSALPVRRKGDLAGVVAVATGGDRAIAVTADGDLDVWSSDDPGAVIAAHIASEPGFLLRAAALDAKGERLFTLEDGPDERPRIRLSPLSATSFKAGEPIPLPTREGCTSGASAPAERFFAATDTDKGLRALVVEGAGCMRVWDEKGALRVAGLDQDLLNASARVSAAAIDRSFEHVVLGSSDGTVSTWAIVGDPRSQVARLTRIATERRRHDGPVRAIAFHPDGRFFVTAGDDGQAWLWAAEDGRALTRLGAHPAPITWAAFRPDGSEIVTGGGGGWIRAFATRTRIDDPVRLENAIDTWLPRLARPPAP